MVFLLDQTKETTLLQLGVEVGFQKIHQKEVLVNRMEVMAMDLLWIMVYVGKQNLFLGPTVLDLEGIYQKNQLIWR